MFSCLNCFSTKRKEEPPHVDIQPTVIQDNVSVNSLPVQNNNQEEVDSVQKKKEVPEVPLKKVSSHLFLEICKLCDKSIAIKDEVLNGEDHWHFSCFQCKECRTSLVNQKYYEKEECLQCEACFQKNIPKCLTCKQKVFKGGLQLAGENQSYNWHVACMKCSHCSQKLTKENLKFKENLFCADCFVEVFYPKCAVCKQAVLGDQLMYKDEAYHESCFTCDVCGKPLKDQKFVPKEGKKVCAMCNIQELI
jgi:hypothetical protein